MIRMLALVLAFISMPVFATGFDYKLKAEQVTADTYVFIGLKEDFNTTNGGNIVNAAFIVGDSGVIVIDTGSSLRYGQQMRKAIASVTSKPVKLVINTHHHPDHFLGNQAFQDVAIAAHPVTRQGIATEGNGFAENLFRMSGDWMKGTEVVSPTQDLAPGKHEVMGRTLRLMALDGHTRSDLVIYDEKSGVLFASDLVFNDRAPTTPHADVSRWLKALDIVEAITREPGFRFLVPGHGEVTRDAKPLEQTRAWLTWLDATVRAAAQAGLDMNELLAQPLPPQFAKLPLAKSEFGRSVTHLFPAAEAEALSASAGR
jgi:quinoprotein relay system zinc metallohydrolase 1